MMIHIHRYTQNVTQLSVQIKVFEQKLLVLQLYTVQHLVKLLGYLGNFLILHLQNMNIDDIFTYCSFPTDIPNIFKSKILNISYIPINFNVIYNHRAELILIHKSNAHVWMKLVVPEGVKGFSGVDDIFLFILESSIPDAIHCFSQFISNFRHHSELEVI